MKIMVPFRGESIPEAALPEASRLADAMDGDIVLVAVAQPPKRARRGHTEAPRPKPRARAKKAPDDYDGRVKQRLEPSADPVSGIIHAAEEESPDIIVLLSGGFVAGGGVDEKALVDQLHRETRIPVRLIGQEVAD
ncbi:MAG TPA: universal stress protein [Dehalococcoidia bacterium]|jgi:nucleotide-binding universal stress UspA family protein